MEIEEAEWTTPFTAGGGTAGRRDVEAVTTVADGLEVGVYVGPDRGSAHLETAMFIVQFEPRLSPRLRIENPAAILANPGSANPANPS